MDEKVLDPTSNFAQQTTHMAKSIWKKASGVIPIIPDEEDAFEVVIEQDSEPWLDKNGKSVFDPRNDQTRSRDGFRPRDP